MQRRSLYTVLCPLHMRELYKKEDEVWAVPSMTATGTVPIRVLIWQVSALGAKAK